MSGIPAAMVPAPKLTGCPRDQISGTVLLAKEPHFTKELSGVEVADDHLLLGIFNVINNDRYGAVEDQIKLLARLALPKNNGPRFHRDTLTMLEKCFSIGNTHAD